MKFPIFKHLALHLPIEIRDNLKNLEKYPGNLIEMSETEKGSSICLGILYRNDTHSMLRATAGRQFQNEIYI